MGLRFRRFYDTILPRIDSMKGVYEKTTAGNADDAAEYARAQVLRGAMAKTVYGTGTTSARSQPNVLAGADGTLTDSVTQIVSELSEGESVSY